MLVPAAVNGVLAVRLDVELLSGDAHSGTAAAQTEALQAAVTVRSLNHRYLDVSVHVSRRLQALETDIKRVVQERISRGRVELAVQAAFTRDEEGVVVAPRFGDRRAAPVVSSSRRPASSRSLEPGMALPPLRTIRRSTSPSRPSRIASQPANSTL